MYRKNEAMQITDEDVQSRLRKLFNWEIPGRDRMHYCYLKELD